MFAAPIRQRKTAFGKHITGECGSIWHFAETKAGWPRFQLSVASQNGRSKLVAPSNSRSARPLSANIFLKTHNNSIGAYESETDGAVPESRNFWRLTLHECLNFLVFHLCRIYDHDNKKPWTARVQHPLIMTP
jgi:hypothetical protein